MTEIENLQAQLKCERDLAESYRERQVLYEDRLMAVGAALGVKIDRMVPTADELLSAVSALKSRGDRAQAEVQQLKFEKRYVGPT